MGTRVKGKAKSGHDEHVYEDSTQDQRESTVDGQTFHLGPNEVRNFADEGVGAAHAAFRGGATISVIQEDANPFGSSRF